MIGYLRNLRDRMRGGGAYAINLPPLDGTLRPNNDLEEASVLAQATAPSHLCVAEDDLWFASGSQVMRMAAGGQAEPVQSFSKEITALAVASADQMFVALGDGSMALPQGYSCETLPEAARRCVTAICLGQNGDAFIAIGATNNVASDWSKDLLERGQSGSVWRLGPDGSASCLAEGLAWPAGLLVQGGGLLVSEASRARLIRIENDGHISAVLSNLPGYPAGISPAASGGYRLCIMAPRNQLIEFILREREFVDEMIATTDREHWIAPSLKAPASFLEPLQGGAMKQLGIMKPWAPSRSTGLVICLNQDFVPTQSHHSRADGKNHGTTSSTEWNAALIVASYGNGQLLRLPQQGDRA